VGDVAYVLYSSPTLHDTSYSAKQVNHSTAASQERTPANLPAVPGLPAGHTCWRARWVSPVLRTCLVATTLYARSRYQPLPNSEHGCSCCRRRGIAKPARTMIFFTTAKETVVGMLYCGVRLYLVAAGHEDAQGVANFVSSCSPERSGATKHFHMTSVVRWK